MNTIKDVAEVLIATTQIAQIFGASADFLQEWNTRRPALAQAIMQEAGFESIDDLDSNPEQELGPRAEAEFQDLKVWLATQHDSFKHFANA